ncbi:NAD(P)-binding protein [Melanomma pulvis-pyrius CBS 109.77]|uniref:NAD(P)-binding protein n=1 Tax=Melanomma pulvis-pyrius CBS 109.77 TaxID=1314802 RepID=A0A6A6XN78_9PLEO|nr:NAD(P)-binding protein [Melanomma pulvis-pyrius CBS 109.77]
MSVRHVLITGGSRGIGLAIARLFAQNSYRCTLISRNEHALKTAISTLPPLDPKHSSIPHKYIVGDVSDPAFWMHSVVGQKLILTSNTTETHAGHGLKERIDVLVNCAGVTENKLFLRIGRDKLQGIVNTNLTGLMMGTQYLLRNGYIKSKKDDDENYSPVVINMTSLLALQGGFGAVVYSASKAGVLGFTRALAVELGRSGVRVNAIVPGYIETDMIADLDVPRLEKRIPLQRIGKPEEIADAVLFLAKNQYAHNCVINIDGGLSAM